jgi:hypothetical protein
MVPDCPIEPARKISDFHTVVVLMVQIIDDRFETMIIVVLVEKRDPKIPQRCAPD